MLGIFTPCLTATDCQTGSEHNSSGFLILAGISGQSIVVDELYEMFVIAAACKDTMQDHGCRVCCREGVSRGFNSEAMPAPMLLSNSLYPDVTSDDCHEPDDSVDLGQDNDNGEETAGVSSFFVGLSQEENIFPVLMSWLLGPTVVWWSCVFLGKHWVSETVKTNT